MYLETPLQAYLDELASSQSTPGGGSASALSGALAAGLASMVIRLTLGKASYANVQQEMETLLQRVEQLRVRFQQLMQEDSEAYGRLSASFKMPKEHEEQRVARTNAIQERLVEAALVPLEIAERSVELLHCCERIAEIGNSNVLSDVATGTMLAAGGGTGAAWMVRTNLSAMKDQELVRQLSGRLSTTLEGITTVSQRVLTLVGERA